MEKQLYRRTFAGVLGALALAACSLEAEAPPGVPELPERRAYRYDGVAGSSESEVVAALEALGYTSREGREAARAAVASLDAQTSLEDRVKEALRILRRD